MADKKVAVILTGDSSGAVRSIKLTQEELDKLGKKSKETESSIADYAKKAASSFGSVAVSVAKYGAAAGLAAAGIAGALVKSSIDAADATNILAGKLGITTESLSKLQYAAKLADVEQSSLESGLKKLSRTLVDAADPASAAAKAFSAIGLSAAEIIKLPADVQLQKIADALGQVENASERSALAQEIFGRSGADLLPLLNEGSAAIAAYGDELARLGGVIDSDFAQKAAQFNDNLDRMKTAVQGVGFALAEEAIKPMEDFTNEIVRLAQDPESIEAIVEGIKNIGQAAKVTGQILAGLAGDLKDLFTRDLEEVQTEIINVSQMLESLQKIEQRGGTVDAREKQRWQDKLDALQQERAELKMLVIERKFDNVESGNSVTAARKEAASRKETTGAIKQQTAATKELTAAEKDRREDEMAAIMAKRESDLGLYETTAATKSLTTAIVEQKAESDPWAQAMVGAVERIDAAFADAWRNIGDGWGGLLDGMTDALSQWLAEMAHMLITRPLMASISASLTGAGGGAASSLISGGGLLSKIPGIGGAFAPGGMAPFLGQWGVNSGVLSQSFGAGGMGPPQTGFSLSGLGMNLGAGLAGNYLADSMFSGRDSSGYGSIAGGLAGSWFGPIGTGIGSFVGEAIDRALSGSDFSGKRVKLGIGTGPMVNGGGWENSRTLSSGLRVGNLTRRAGDAGLSDEQINTYLSAFDTLDATLTGIARSSGANVDFSKIALAGMPQPYDGGTSGHAFFGSLAKGELRDQLTGAPDEFVRQWIDAIAGSFEEPWRTQVASIDGTTDEMIEGFARLVDTMLDQFLAAKEQTTAIEDQVVVVEKAVDAYAQLKAAEEARIDALTAQAQTLIDTYGDLRGAMARIDPPAQTLVDTWRETSDHLGRMTADLADALGQMPEPGAVDRLRATLGTIGSIGGALVSLDREIFDLRVAQGGSAAVALLREREASLFGAIGSSSDPSGTAAEAARVAVQRIQLQARIEEESLNARLDQTQTIIDLESSARDAQIDGLRQQIDAAESLQSITRDLIGFVDELQFGDLSSLNPGDQLGAARSLFERTLGGARSGDMAALGNLQSVAGSYLQEAQGYFGGATSPYADIFGAVTGALREVGALGVSDTSLLMQQLATLESIDAAQQVQQEAQQIVIDTTDQQISALGEIRGALVDRQADLQYQAEQQTAAANRQIELLQQTVTNQEAEIRQRAAAFEALQAQIIEIKNSLAAMERAADLEAARA